MNSYSILLVEDDEIQAKDIRKRLEAMGYQWAGTADNGEHALKLCEDRSPDLVLMDIRIAGDRDGIDTAMEMRRRHHVPVVFLTVCSEEETLDRAKLAEPYGYLLKPFDNRALKSSIEIALYKHRAEEELHRLNRICRDEHARLGMALTAANAAVFEWDVKRNITTWSEEMAALYGLDTGEPEGKRDWRSCLHPDDLQETDAAIAKALKCGDFRQYFRILRPDGSIRWVSARAKVLFDDDGNPVRMDGIHTDVTEQRQAEGALEQSESRYRRLFEKATEGIVLADGETDVILDCNEAFSKMSGYERAELIGKSMSLLYPGAADFEAGPLRSSHTRQPGELKGFVLPTELLTKSGVAKPVEVKADTMEIGGRTIIQGFFRDVSDELRYHYERETTLKLLRLLNTRDSTREMISSLTNFLRQWTRCEAVGVRLRDGVDFPYYETRGFPPEFVLAESSLCARDAQGELILDDLGKPLLQCMCGNILSGRFDPALPFFTARGSFWTNCTTELLACTTEADRQTRTRNRCNGEGYESVALIALRHGSEILGLLQVNDRARERFTPELILFLENAAEQIGLALAQRQAQEALRLSEQRFRDVIEATGEVIWETDLNWRFTYVSELAKTLLGYRSEQALGRRVFELMEDGEARKLKSFLNEKLEAKEGFHGVEHRVADSSGRFVWLSTTGMPMLDERGEVVGFRGATLDISARKAAERAMEESEVRYRSLVETSFDWVWELDTHGRYVYASPRVSEILGYPPQEILGLTPFDLMPGEEAGRVEGLFWEIFRERRPFSGLENTCRHRDGREVVMETSGIPVFGPGGEFMGYQGMDRDITDRKKAEREKFRLEAQLRQAQKLEAIGTLAGGIAHDFNNILSPIIGYAEMALDDVPASSSLRGDLLQIVKAGRRARELVQQILSFSRLGQDQVMRPMNMGLVIKEALKLLRASLPATIEMKQNIHKVVVVADATQVHQVIVNLCTNAAHAMEDRGTLDVSLTEVSLSDGELRVLSMPDLNPGPYARLSVSDTGQGMNAETIQHIFDPYFTTKEAGKGTGLGLAVVHGIVKRHGGEVLVQSEPGKGSVFHVYVPAVKAEAKENSSAAPPLPRGTERVLLVDDEPIIAAMGAKMMEALGYRVTTRTDPREALDLFRSNPQGFDLLITDYTMPHLTGADLTAELLRIRPDFPVVLCTGFSERLEKGDTQGAIRELVMKPFDRRHLAEAVRRVLDAKNENSDGHFVSSHEE